jgi:hypothetical protein
MMTISELRHYVQLVDLGGYDRNAPIQEELKEIRKKETELRNYRRQIEEFRLHLSRGHAWVTDDTTLRTICAICGWDGDI